MKRSRRRLLALPSGLIGAAITGASLGLQAGAQRFGYAMSFTNDDALQYLQKYYAHSTRTLNGGKAITR